MTAETKQPKQKDDTLLLLLLLVVVEEVQIQPTTALKEE
jgi:hypothetical protein